MKKIKIQKNLKEFSIEDGIVIKKTINNDVILSKWLLVMETHSVQFLNSNGNIKKKNLCGETFKIVNTVRSDKLEMLQEKFFSIMKDLEVHSKLLTCYCGKNCSIDLADSSSIQIVLNCLMIIFLITGDFRFLNSVVKSLHNGVNGVNLENIMLKDLSNEIIKDLNV